MFVCVYVRMYGMFVCKHDICTTPQTTTRDDVKDFAKVVRNKISKRHRHCRKDGFLKYGSKDKS